MVDCWVESDLKCQSLKLSSRGRPNKNIKNNNNNNNKMSSDVRSFLISKAVASIQTLQTSAKAHYTINIHRVSKKTVPVLFFE